MAHTSAALQGDLLAQFGMANKTSNVSKLLPDIFSFELKTFANATNVFARSQQVGLTAKSSSASAL